MNIICGEVEEDDKALTPDCMVLYEPDTGVALLSTIMAPEDAEVRMHVDPVEVFDAEVVEVLTLDVEIDMLLLEVVVITTTDALEVFEVFAVADDKERQEHPLESLEVFDLQADAHVGSEVVCVKVVVV